MVRSEPVVATWYGPGFEGTTTASGEPFNASDYTAASRTLPFGTKLIVTYEGRSVVVRVNDRGPFSEADLDLSQAAAEYLGMTAVGVATVDVVQADPSTPTGPYTAPNGGAGDGSGADGAIAVGTGASTGPEDQSEGQYQYEPDDAGTEETGTAAGEDGTEEQQYGLVDALASVGEDQYAEEDVAGEDVAPEPATPAPPAPVVEAAPVAQEIVVPPPPEVVVPGSTVERRLALAEQPAPEGSPSAETNTLPAAPAVEAPEPEPEALPEEPAEEPVVEEPVAQETAEEEPAAAVEAANDSGSDDGDEGLPSETLTVLPDTGGPLPGAALPPAPATAG